jgi:periplasmic divalent cation tolerance protein
MQVSHEIDEVLSLVTTVGSEADARRLARGLVEARLAACVQVEPGLESHYRWLGKVQADAEWRLTAKTLPACLGPVQAWLAEHHPYELPQLVWQVLCASPAYAAWVREEVSAPVDEDLPPLA